MRENIIYSKFELTTLAFRDSKHIRSTCADCGSLSSIYNHAAFVAEIMIHR